MIFQVLLAIALANLAWSFICLERNVRKARALKVPYIRIPFDVTNVLWLTVQPILWAILDRLPIQWSSYPDFVRLSRRDWQFREKATQAVQLGPVWALVTPVTLYLHFTDPQAIKHIFARPAQFQRPVKEYKLLEIYGPCLSTAGWEDWARHRKVLAAPFNESIMRFVWNEAVRQTQGMLQSWTTIQSAGIPSVQTDTRTVALNVLAATALQKSYDFRGSAEAPVADEAGSYRDTLQTVLNNAILLMILPYRFLRGPYIPRSLVSIGDAARSFERHMVNMLDDETTAMKQGKAGSGGILSGFVRALDTHQKEPAAGVSAKKGLSAEEILGNLFIINFAGYDTSAAALAFSMHLLAIHPEVQTWLAEEITAVTSGQAVEEWDYKTMFPRLQRCQAILLETLRLYPPIVSVPKWTETRTQILDVGHQTLTIPPGVYTSPHLIAIHTHPKYFRTLEVVAVLAGLFRSHRVSVARKDGESREAASRRAEAAVNNVNMEVILRMEYTKDLRLVCSKA
ncbi:hypothetical protein E8E14_004771 [Neopestalotiopsis sp. 37M]|nr:hypothetical protein E8E14_004771 [Neopestalotiopsis sp. 37M]